MKIEYQILIWILIYQIWGGIFISYLDNKINIFETYDINPRISERALIFSLIQFWPLIIIATLYTGLKELI